MSLTERLFRPYLANPSRPVITHYDDAAPSRVELSASTVANWAAKTANWLTEEHDLEPGDPVAMLLPAHWQTVGVLLGAWWCGARITGDPSGASVAFVPRGVSADGADVTAVVSLDPMGRDLGGSTGDLVDFVGEARVHGDDFLALQPVPGSTPALENSTVDDVVALATTRAGELGITAESRVLSTLDWTVPGGVLDGLLAVLAVGGSLVQVTNPDRASLPGRVATEKSTLTLG